MKTAFIKRETQTNDSNLKPMSFWSSLLFFGIPTMIMFFSFYVVMPKLMKLGINPFYSYFFSMGGSLLLMLGASLLAYKLENNPWNWRRFKERYRLHTMKKKDWILFIMIFVGSSISYILISPFLEKLIKSGIIPIPSSIPNWQNPLTSLPPSVVLDQTFGGLKGNWLAVFAFLLLLIINILGEELWWRGYILPRQELVFGNLTWIVHGLFWAFFHAFVWWEIIGLLTVTLPLSFMVWRLKNNTPGLLLHFVVNSVHLIPIIVGVIR